MGKATLQSRQSFVPLGNIDYGMFIPEYPEIGDLAVSITVPSRTTETVRVEMFGEARMWPGRRISQSNQLQTSILLDRNTQTYAQLVAIHEASSSNTTGNRDGAEFTVKVVHYDSIGLEAMAFIFENCWISDIEGYELSATDESGIAMVPVTFCYMRSTVVFTAMGDGQSDPAKLSQSATYIMTHDGKRLALSQKDSHGNYPELSQLRYVLQGSDPFNIINAIQQKVASRLATSLSQLNNLASVVAAARGTSAGISSKVRDLGNAIKSGDIRGSLTSALSLSGSISGVGSALSSIKSLLRRG